MPTTTTTTVKPNQKIECEKKGMDWKKTDSGGYGCSPKSFNATYMGADAKDLALDNLWLSKGMTQKLKVIGDKPQKLIPSADNRFWDKDEKFEGYIVYFLPKDKKGNVIDKPKRLLRLMKGGKSTSDYINADTLVPFYKDVIANKAKWISLGESDYVAKAEAKLSGVSQDAIASNFTSLDDAATSMNEYGLDGNVFELSNTKNLDDSFSNFIKPRISKKKMKKYGTWISNAEGDYSEVQAGGVNWFKPKKEIRGKSKGQVNFNGEYSNLTNESLLDGLTENTSLLNASGKVIPLTERFDYNADGEEEIEYFEESNDDYSNSVGSWFKGLFNGKKKTALEEVSDPNVAVVDAKTMAQAYQESGSKNPFRDWVSSESGKGVVGAIAQIASAIINKNAPSASTTTYQSGDFTAPKYAKDEEKEETKILGMSPIVFGVVALGLIAVGSIVAIKVIKANK